MAKHVLAAPLKAAPGEKFQYANFGYALLAAIVEKASRRSFETYLKAKLFKPSGMGDTGFIRDRDLDAKRATVRRGKRGADATAVDWFWGWGYRGMGGVVSTAWDLHRWDRALREDDVLSEEARKKLFTPALSGYALGWRVGTTARGTRRAEHSGGVHGYACKVARYLEDDALIVILSNGKSDIHGIDRRISALLFAPPKIEASFDVSPFTLNDYKGVVLPDTATWSATKDGSHVRLGLLDREGGHVAASIRLPEGVAKKLAADLSSMLAGRVEKAGAPGMEAGVFLGPYELAEGKLELSESLSLMVMPRYVGRGEDGKRVVDERITLVLTDAKAGQWPVMAKMDPVSARRLLSAVRAALD